jgi:hypothetical protein
VMWLWWWWLDLPEAGSCRSVGRCAGAGAQRSRGLGWPGGAHRFHLPSFASGPIVAGEENESQKLGSWNIIQKHMFYFSVKSGPRLSLKVETIGA